MRSDVYRYEFAPGAPADEVEATLLLAVVAVESLHGEAQARLDIGHLFDPDRRACVVDATTPVGRDLDGADRSDIGHRSPHVAHRAHGLLCRRGSMISRGRAGKAAAPPTIEVESNDRQFESFVRANATTNHSSMVQPPLARSTDGEYRARRQ